VFTGVLVVAEQRRIRPNGIEYGMDTRSNVHSQNLSLGLDVRCRVGSEVETGPAPSGRIDQDVQNRRFPPSTGLRAT
jgi:hypothetical protein